jgi:hypothetical protein
LAVDPEQQQRERLSGLSRPVSERHLCRLGPHAHRRVEDEAGRSLALQRPGRRP